MTSCDIMLSFIANRKQHEKITTCLSKAVEPNFPPIVKRPLHQRTKTYRKLHHPSKKWILFAPSAWCTGKIWPFNVDISAVRGAPWDCQIVPFVVKQLHNGYKFTFDVML